jgi:hypothetical protein
MNEREILQAARSAALASPCLLAEETARSGFAWMPWEGHSLVLTINSGYE